MSVVLCLQIPTQLSLRNLEAKPCAPPPYSVSGIISVLGIGAFVASKNSVDKNRYENMKIRERMRQSNVGQYEVKEARRFDA
uniref:Uncharacterized protein n=1 Tax=Anopheles arabiensis TaxID=7173 RepID=A0A182I624_ANOAR